MPLQADVDCWPELWPIEKVKTTTDPAEPRPHPFGPPPLVNGGGEGAAYT
jgi:hypothetical protein